MKKVFIILFVAVMVAAPVFAATSLLSKPAATVYLIRNKTISFDALNAKVEEYKAQGINYTQEEVLNVMVNDELFLQGADRDGVKVTDQQLDGYIANVKANIEAQGGKTLSESEFAELLKSQTGMTLAEYRENLKTNYVVQTYLSMKKGDMLNSYKTPTEDDIEAFFLENRSAFSNPDYSRISHVFFLKEGEKGTEKYDQAQSVLNEIRNGTITFEKAVSKYSEDPTSKKASGDIGWITLENSTIIQLLGKDFVREAMRLDDGEVCAKVLTSPTGYHIVKCTVSSPAKMLTLEDTVNPATDTTVHDYIGQGLLEQNAQEAYLKAVDSLIEDLRKQATIKIMLNK